MSEARLTHWELAAMNICVSGLSSTNPSSEPVLCCIVRRAIENKHQWNFNQLNEILLSGKIHFKISSAKCRPLHSELNVSKPHQYQLHEAWWCITGIKKHFHQRKCSLNCLLGNTYVRHWPGSSFVKILVYRLFGTKSLSEPVLTCYQLDWWEQTSVTF